MTQKLSKREKQVLKMLLAEYSQKEISDTLNLSYSRVHSIKSIIMEKWEVDTMVGLVKEGIKRGYLELEPDTFDISIGKFENRIIKSSNNHPIIIYTYKEH